MRKVEITKLLGILTLLMFLMWKYDDFLLDTSTEHFVPEKKWYFPSSEFFSNRWTHPSVAKNKPWYLSNRTQFLSSFEVNHQWMKNGTKTIFWPNAKAWIAEVLKGIDFNNCQVKSCEIRTDGKQYYKSSDAVVFDQAHPVEQSVRPRNQVWIFMSMESPIYARAQNFRSEYWRGKFNWTVTYRLDSDIVLGYGSAGRANKPNFNAKSLDVVIQKKKKLVAWVVSHCSTSSLRETYARQLSKHISVDIYGKCGNSGEVTDSIFDDIEQNYKFYLAFENSICKDYVTEKFFRVQNRNVVLVVLGGADYSMIYPNDTYINVKDFQSPKALADRLLFLDQNDSEYKSYLIRKSLFKYLPNRNNAMLGLCDVCAKLHESTIGTKIYDNITRWYMDNMCYQPITHWYDSLRWFH